MFDTFLFVILAVVAGSIGYVVGTETPIKSEHIRHAYTVCEANGGVKDISHANIRCMNGAKFRTKL